MGVILLHKLTVAETSSLCLAIDDRPILDDFHGNIIQRLLTISDRVPCLQVLYLM